jgi:hypothetical protein
LRTIDLSTTLPQSGVNEEAEEKGH